MINPLQHRKTLENWISNILAIIIQDAFFISIQLVTTSDIQHDTSITPSNK